MCWTSLLLSFAGRVQLVRAVLCSIQAYWSNHFVLPKTIHKHIIKLLTRFLWRGDVTKVEGARVSWEHLCLPREEGGLGIKNPYDWNMYQILAHLCKVVGKTDSL